MTVIPFRNDDTDDWFKGYIFDVDTHTNAVILRTELAEWCQENLEYECYTVYPVEDIYEIIITLHDEISVTAFKLRWL